MPRKKSWKESLGKGKLVVGFVSPLEVPDDSLHRRAARILLALVFVVVFFCGYFPFDFVFSGGLRAIRWRFDTRIILQDELGSDAIENLIFFLPLGFALGAMFRLKRLHWIGNALIVLALGCATSTAIEVGQCFLWSRDPSMSDIFNNTIGGGMGFGIYLLIGQRAFDIANDALKRKAVRQFLFPAMLLIAIAFAAIVCVAPLTLGRATDDLSVWNPEFSISMGNEIGGNRGWPGFVERAIVASVAADESQVNALFANQSPRDIFTDPATLQAWYDLHGEPPFVDRTGKQPPMKFIDSAAYKLQQPPPASNPAAAPVNVWVDHWLSTTGPAESLNSAIMKSNQFTVAVRISSTRQDPGGQPRIFTISSGPNDRNFTLAQENKSLLLRLHTGTTGRNGDQPQFIINNVFADNRTQTIVVTFADSLLTIYVNSPDQQYSTLLTPEAAVIASLYPRSTGWNFYPANDKTSTQSIVYRGLAFFLLAIAVTIAFNLAGKLTSRQRIFAIVLSLVFTMIVFELLMHVVAHQPLHVRGIIAGLITAALGVVLVNIDSKDEVIRLPK